MLDMNSNKPIIYCGKGVLERIKELPEVLPLTKENLLDCINNIKSKPSNNEVIIISNGLTKEQIEHIKNYYSNLKIN